MYSLKTYKITKMLLQKVIILVMKTQCYEVSK